MPCHYDTWGTHIDTATKRVRRERMAAVLATVADPELAASRDACATDVLAPAR